jgi:hypothetical protein
MNNQADNDQIARKKSQYDEFPCIIQHPKMKELWDNIDDDAWENA